MKDQVFWKSAKLISIIGFCAFLRVDGTLGGEVTKMVGFDSKCEKYHCQHRENKETHRHTRLIELQRLQARISNHGNLD